MNDGYIELLENLGLPTSFDGLSDDELICIEDRLADEIQLRGINDEGNGLNEYGRRCLDAIEAIPDD